jgi:DNA-binding SARP family transcriptional activator/tetratricopeptide (TPR) repeat protein
MRFSLLGPLVVADSVGSPIALGGPRLRVLLAALLLRTGIPVPAGELAEVVWDGSPPPRAVSTLRSYVRRLRRTLGDDGARIVASGPGYLIRVARVELDVQEFEAFCRDARVALQAGEWVDAAGAAARALRLWRAPPLLDVPSEALRCEFVPGLERLRLQVLEDRFDAGLRLGHQQELIPQLLDMTSRYPLQERFHAQLMLALAGSGRRAQALDAYQEARRVLVGELGIEPGTELRDIHRRILAGDVGRLPARPEDSHAREIPRTRTASALVGVSDSPADEAPVPTEPTRLVLPQPAQLPADIADFTGRSRQISDVRAALIGAATASGPGAVRIVVVAGAAGLGKTTLAVHAAHQVRDLFPDGQLFVQLAGASGQAAVAGEVLARLLRDLGVDDDKVPAGGEERAALYRTKLADRRVLILLDDARDAAQVRPLLPGSASCAVVVTTRNRTPNLLSTKFVDLGTLPCPEAQELFSRVVGDARPAAEPEATTEVLRACSGLPLAIRICAARLATRPQWRIATMAARLRDERRRLDELQVGDLEVRASFQVSYDSLGGGRQRADPVRVFRLLGLWQGRRISLPAAAALTGERAEDVAGALETLVDANLLESPEPDWYQLHDLLRLFAAERAQAEETPQARLEGVTRLLQWYPATAVAAADILSPYRYRIPDEESPVPGRPPGSPKEALTWYDHEYANLFSAVRQAAAAGLHDAAWRLATALFPLFIRRGNWADCITAHRIAVNSARAAGSRPGEAWALHHLGYALARLGDAEAFSCLQEASALRREMRDTGGEGRTAMALAEAHYWIHGPQAAYDHSLRCLELLRQAEDPALLGTGLNNHGEFCRDLGKAEEATECLREALGIVTAIGGGNGQGHVTENLGRIYLESGRLPEAIARLSEAHSLHLASGDLMGQAAALKYLGQAQHGIGQEDQARESLQAALALFVDLDAAVEVEKIQAALAASRSPVHDLRHRRRHPGNPADDAAHDAAHDLAVPLECPSNAPAYPQTARRVPKPLGLREATAGLTPGEPHS